MAKEKQAVVVLQTTDATDGGNKIVKEFTPEHAKNTMAYEKSRGLEGWEKAPEGAKVTDKLVIADEPTAEDFALLNVNSTIPVAETKPK